MSPDSSVIDNTTAILQIIASASGGIIVGLVLLYTDRKRKREGDALIIKKEWEVTKNLWWFLKEMRAKCKRQHINESSGSTHLMENPDDYDYLVNIFRKWGYILTDDLCWEFNKITEKDTYFGLKKESSMTINLSDMEDMAESRCKKLEKYYKKKFGVRIALQDEERMKIENEE